MKESKSFNLRNHPKSLAFNERFPVVTATLTGCETMNQQLIEAIEKEGNRNISESNLSANRTRWQMYEEGGEGSQAFQQLCEIACQFSLEHSPRNDWQAIVTSCWGAIYEPGDFARPHDHWPSTWSFVYYLEVGESPSPLVFTNAQRAIAPKENMLCLFPGWVMHEVPTQQGASRRIMVAGNISPKTPS